MLKFIYFKILVVLFTLFNLLNLLHANPVNAWNKASPSIVSVLPTWPGFKKTPTPGLLSPQDNLLWINQIGTCNLIGPQ